jgi:hypothetical protein
MGDGNSPPERKRNVSMKPTAEDERRATEAERAVAVAARDAAYRERDQLVAALSKMFAAHLAIHDPLPEGWDPEWRYLVCVHLPTGQATWHIHENEVMLFGHLAVAPQHWDTHTTEEKYRRLNALTEEDMRKWWRP